MTNVKPLPGHLKHPELPQRIQIVISDGAYFYTSTMLGTLMNSQVGKGMIEVNSVIRMKDYVCNVIQETCRIIIILDLNVVRKASEVRKKTW